MWLYALMSPFYCIITGCLYTMAAELSSWYRGYSLILYRDTFLMFFFFSYFEQWILFKCSKEVK